MIDLEELFSKHLKEYLEFDKVIGSPSKRPDLSAFLLLEHLLPGKTGDIVSNAQHDEIWLDIEAEELAAVATEDQIITLIRCGVRLNDGDLCMFV